MKTLDSIKTIIIIIHDCKKGTVWGETSKKEKEEMKRLTGDEHDQNTSCINNPMEPTK
jgi:hypothetical protein